MTVTDSKVAAMMQSSQEQQYKALMKMEADKLIARIRNDPTLESMLAATLDAFDKDTHSRIWLHRNPRTVRCLPGWLVELVICAVFVNGKDYMLRQQKNKQFWRMIFEFLVCGWQGSTALTVREGRVNTTILAFGVKIVNNVDRYDLVLKYFQRVFDTPSTSLPDNAIVTNDVFNHSLGQWSFAFKSEDDGCLYFGGFYRRFSGVTVQMPHGMNILASDTYSTVSAALAAYIDNNASSWTATLKLRVSGMSIQIVSLMKDTSMLETVPKVIMPNNEWQILDGMCSKEEFSAEQHIHSQLTLQRSQLMMGGTGKSPATAGDVLFQTICRGLASPKRRTNVSVDDGDDGQCSGALVPVGDEIVVVAEDDSENKANGNQGAEGDEGNNESKTCHW